MISVDKPKAGEAGRRLQSRGLVRISDKLGEVIGQNRRADQICAGREVDYGGSCRGGGLKPSDSEC
jgi:hypothetical protein